MFHLKIRFDKQLFVEANGVETKPLVKFEQICISVASNTIMILI